MRCNKIFWIVDDVAYRGAVAVWNERDGEGAVVGASTFKVLNRGLAEATKRRRRTGRLPRAS